MLPLSIKTFIKHSLLSKYSHIILLSIIIIFVNLWPSFFLIPGTYFFLDTSFFPFTQWKGFFEISLYWHFLDALNFLFGYQLFSKLYLLSTLILGVFTGLLISKYISIIFPKQKSKLLDIYSIMIAVYNPFIYERIISQTGIAMGSYFLVIGTLFLLIYLKNSSQTEKPKFSLKDKNLLYASLFLGLSLMIYYHSIFLIIMILLILLSFNIKNYISFFVILVVIVTLNLNWLIGEFFIQNSASVIGKLQFFDVQNIEAFKGNSLSGLGVDITHLLGYGFWGEKYHIISPEKLISFWYIFAGIIVILAGYGLYLISKKSTKTASSLLCIALIGYVLSLGLSSPIFAGFNNLLYQNIPFYTGLREPQKWLILTQMVYMIGFVIGSLSLLSKTRKISRKILIVFIFFLPVLWTPGSVIGYFGQINISDYPNDIFTSRDFINDTLPVDSKIVNFPWHSYMACAWTHGKITSNRIDTLLYPNNIIVSDNIEIGTLYSNSQSLLSGDIDTFINTKDISILNNNDIGYIYFYKTCGNASDYVFLKEDPSTYKNIFESPNISIYKINYEK